MRCSLSRKLQQIPRVIDWNGHGDGLISGHNIDQLVFNLKVNLARCVNSSHEDRDHSLAGNIQRYFNHYGYCRTGAIENR